MGDFKNLKSFVMIIERADKEEEEEEEANEILNCKG